MKGIGVADWHGREEIRHNLKAFIDRGMTTHQDVAEYWDSPGLKVFRGFVSMKFDNPSKVPVRTVMAPFFYMDPKQPERVSHWFGSVGPVEF